MLETVHMILQLFYSVLTYRSFGVLTHKYFNDSTEINTHAKKFKTKSSIL